MNIFALDKDPYVAARYHNDKHCVKMILEDAQMLSTALHESGVGDVPYRPTHKNHPSAKWVRETRSNYKWAIKLLDGLLQQYSERYNKVHACQRYFNFFAMHANSIPDGPLTPIPQCMPDQYRLPEDQFVQAYRNYYHGEKAYFSKWRTGNVPEWWTL